MERFLNGTFSPKREREEEKKLNHVTGEDPMQCAIILTRSYQIIRETFPTNAFKIHAAARLKICGGKSPYLWTFR